MKIYTLELSEDGLANTCFTNVKAIHTWMVNKLDAYTPIGIEEWTYSYENLVWAIKQQEKSGFYAMVVIKCEGGSEITVRELAINTK